MKISSGKISLEFDLNGGIALTGIIDETTSSGPKNYLRQRSMLFEFSIEADRFINQSDQFMVISNVQSAPDRLSLTALSVQKPGLGFLLAVVTQLGSNVALVNLTVANNTN